MDLAPSNVLKRQVFAFFYHSFPYASHSLGVQRYFYVIDSVAYKIVSELITVQMMFYYIFSQCVVKGSCIITVNVGRYFV